MKKKPDLAAISLAALVLLVIIKLAKEWLL